MNNRLTVFEAIGKSCRLVNKNYTPLCGMSMLIYLFVTVSSVVIIAKRSEYANLLCTPFFWIAIALLTFFFICMTKMSIDIIDGKSTILSSFSMKFNQYVNAFISYLICFAIIVYPICFAAVVIIMAFEYEEIGIEPLTQWELIDYFAMAFFVIVFAALIILAIKVIYTPVIVIDKKENVISAIKKSWRITKGNFWRLLGIVTLLVIAHIISFALIYFSAMYWGFKFYSVLFSLGLLYITPVIILSLSLFYRNNLNQEKE